MRIRYSSEQGIILVKQGILEREQGILSAGIEITRMRFSERRMSALTPKADIARQQSNVVCFVPMADMADHSMASLTHASNDDG